MITVTYRPEVEYEPRQIAELQHCIDLHLARRGVRYRAVWVLELTKAGRPHYHLLLWLPRNVKIPKPDQQGWWPHGMTRIELARNAVGYLVKYASKAKDAWQSGGRFPPGARLFGVRGLHDGRPEYQHRMRPFWMRQYVSQGDRVSRCPGGGHLNRTTGEYFMSPYELVDRAPDWSWVEFALRPPQAPPEDCAAVPTG